MACASPRCKNAWTASDRRTRAARSTARHTLAAGAGTGGAYLFQCAVVKGAQGHPLSLARQRALTVLRRTANGWRAQLSFARTRRPGEGIPARTIRPRGNEVWPDESKCSCRSSMPSSPPKRGSSRCPLHCIGRELWRERKSSCLDPISVRSRTPLAGFASARSPCLCGGGILLPFQGLRFSYCLRSTHAAGTLRFMDATELTTGNGRP